MPKRILVILGHPSKNRKTFCEALALAYIKGARSAGHETKLVKLADMSFDPILHEGYQGNQDAERDILSVQEEMEKADHWVIVYPLWLFMIPALLKGFFERSLTKGFAYDLDGDKRGATMLLKGKTARLIQTMGMPNFAYRWIFQENGKRALSTMLRFIGIKPVRVTYCGQAENPSDRRRQRYLAQVQRLGAKSL